ncbi:MAG: alanyl-tRNA editing protein [Patescibacteria group bacterium]
MEQKQIYYDNQYLKELESSVTEIDGNKVVIQENIFFPKTKGELGDFGTVNNIKVVNVEKNDGKVVVELESVGALKISDKVSQKIDWNYRLNGMKLHSALHLVAGVIEKEHNIRAVAGNVYEDRAVLTFKKPVPDMIYIALEDSANELVQENKEIKTYWDEKREGFRWCQVSDLEPISCGGLHVKNTGEISELVFDGNGDKLEVRLKV